MRSHSLEMPTNHSKSRFASSRIDQSEDSLFLCVAQFRHHLVVRRPLEPFRGHNVLETTRSGRFLLLGHHVCDDPRVEVFICRSEIEGSDSATGKFWVLIALMRTLVSVLFTYCVDWAQNLLSENRWPLHGIKRGLDIDFIRQPLIVSRVEPFIYEWALLIVPLFDFLRENSRLVERMVATSEFTLP